MTSILFSPLRMGSVELDNRIVVAPMCQYSANDGCASDWHLMNLMQLAVSGAGLVMLEATAVERHGRITHGCLGLYSDVTEAALGRVMAAARGVGQGVRWGIQLGHAGRKASAQRPWEGRGALGAGEDPWQTQGPSSLAFTDGWHTPQAMTKDDIRRVRDSFVVSAKRAARLGFEVVEIHAAHGYLLHQFLSPLANQRDDEYGGSLANRMRLPLDIAAAVRDALGADIALGFRITGTDWKDGGITIDECVAFTDALKAIRVDYVCVTSGAVAPAAIPVEPGYQVHLAEEVKRRTGMVTRAVGFIADPHQAEAILANQQADCVALGRAFIDDPRWPWHAAEVLGDVSRIRYPGQYERGGAQLWPGVALRQKKRETLVN
ncbi:NADH:flavin oxidoreductase/NADH oxidase [Caballeronia sp. LZ032]|uniref:NADH:flavin oxidoreductase/NADH oxidase n=1 Tax=Caballeronia sp. LZ032 TaxID=3038565 RepID=UPI00285C2C3F|nr:NADH:flavin oxidoreductase/NADH oxidase [Caballeronia sp. LZ032]MDR5879897.1 NADH:flavin oxidoreductase/NADH oxidase [Caballeronia sp. LZ032]